MGPEGRSLSRLATYFHHGGTTFQSPCKIDGRELTYFYGVRNVRIPGGLPGLPKCLPVAGIVDLDRFTDGVWQDPVADGEIAGYTVQTGLEAAYVFFAPIPGFVHGNARLMRYEPAGSGGRGHIMVEHEYRRFALYPDGEPGFQILCDEASTDYGKGVSELADQFMGGYEYQVVPIQPHEDAASFQQWLQRWYKDTYRPAALAWSRIVDQMAKTRPTLLSDRFLEQYGTDMRAIRASARSQ